MKAKTKMMIVPGILEKDLNTIKKYIHNVEKYVERVQIDIEDGTFTENNTYCDISQIEKIETITKIELHLMVQNPFAFIPSKLQPVNKIISHVESNTFGRDLLEVVREKGFEVGIALNPETSIYEIEPFLDFCDCVQFMSVHPGFQGAQIILEVLDKVKNFARLYPDIPIEIDGGVNKDTIKIVAESGATMVEVGGFIFKNERSPEENIIELERICEEI